MSSCKRGADPPKKSGERAGRVSSKSMSRWVKTGNGFCIAASIFFARQVDDMSIS